MTAMANLTALNTGSVLHDEGDGRRGVLFGDGLIIWTYIDPGTASVVVSVDTSGLDPGSLTVRDNVFDGTLRLRVDVGGQVVFDDTDEARKSGTVVVPAGC
jgi:hypothetical protein